MIDEGLAARAEEMGSICREMGDPRDSNPYIQHMHVSPVLAGEFAEAWWRGWDQADASLQHGKLP